MPRKPIHMEMTGGKTPRQRAWEAIRQRRDGFVPDDIVEHGDVTKDIVRDFLQVLEVGGYIEVVSEEKINTLCVKRTYRLIRDNGAEAPRLTKTGEEVTQGGGNEAMWGTLRRMFKMESVDYRQLAAFAGTQRNPISEQSAKTYMLALASAGYLQCVQPAVKGRKALPARYRLNHAMDTGRRAPMIQRTKTVFDPNLNMIVWQEKMELDDDQ